MNHPQPPRPSNPISRICVSLALGAVAFGVGSFVLVGVLGLEGPLLRISIFGLLLGGLWIITFFPERIRNYDEMEYMRWRKRAEDLGRAKNPATEGHELARLLSIYPKWAELIEAVHANPSYLNYVRGNQK